MLPSLTSLLLGYLSLELAHSKAVVGRSAFGSLAAYNKSASMIEVLLLKMECAAELVMNHSYMSCLINERVAEVASSICTHGGLRKPCSRLKEVSNQCRAHDRIREIPIVLEVAKLTTTLAMLMKTIITPLLH